MTIDLEYFNVLVPIHLIRKKYPGGWEGCLRDHESHVGGRVRFDDHLFRDGAMNSIDAHAIIERWQELGFRATAGRPEKWIDLCVVGSLLGGPALPCDWLEVSADGTSASFRGASNNARILNRGLQADEPAKTLDRSNASPVVSNGFPAEVAEKLMVYVYRLIDPRNGQTFYVGKGQGDRIFQHARGIVADDDRSGSAKLQRIKEIIASGFQVAHVIHRHGMNEDTAFQVEAALIDALPGLTNLVGGHGSDEYGVAHAEEIIRRYSAEPFVPAHRILLISIANSVNEESRSSIYEATRYAWRLDPTRARDAEVILAHRRGLVVGAFIADDWLPATVTNFPALSSASIPDRWGFVGREAPSTIIQQYMQKRVPERYRRKGAANPIRFIEPHAGAPSEPL